MMVEATKNLNDSTTKLVLIVSKKHVKQVKTALEQADALDRSSKITSAAELPDILGVGITIESVQDYMSIPTKLGYPSIHGPGFTNDVFSSLGLEDLESQIFIHSLHTTTQAGSDNRQERNPLRKAIKLALSEFETFLDTSQHPDLTPSSLAATFPESYSIYPPLLLLPHNAFSQPPWQTLLTHNPHHTTPFWTTFWTRIASSMHITHIALNSPIPAQTSPSSSTDSDNNILRSPLNITPLHGPFGPLPTLRTLSTPTHSDFGSALWVTATQNGIHQTWAPLYTMFSRGNIREKTRLLKHPDIAREFDDKGASVVDMYAGIGYFAFSYKKAGDLSGARKGRGVSKVLCFEINPWSVEGLRRGAERNGWTSKIFCLDESSSSEEDARGIKKIQDELAKGAAVDEDFLIFQMSNEYALDIVSSFPRDTLAPIRHVNLGLLPSSRLSWRSAARLVDGERGGWVHVHENVGVREIDERSREVEREFQRAVEEFDQERAGSEGVWRERRVKVEHVERVKMYAPGVVHCVFDVAISS